ncbi:MAG TPA: futalosine hydrolase [Bacteroidales bacterium]|jgi:futalosine hydrolase|nr:futalosine hydrolase [Bacteroidales bacterium]
MQKRILFVTATALESRALERVEGIKAENGVFRFGHFEIVPLVAGVGQVSTVYNISKWLARNGHPDIALNTGIAGSFKADPAAGAVVIIKNDCFADLGIEDHEKFLTLAERGLADPDEFPFSNGWIHADEKYISLFEKKFTAVNAITVNTVTGSDKTISRLVEKFNPSLETMEGASFFYICRRESIPFLAIRAVSNSIEPGNRHTWKIELALESLSLRLREIFLMLE